LFFILVLYNKTDGGFYMEEKKNYCISNPALISTLWIFLSLNYIFCDVLSNMEKETLRGLIAGNVGGIVLTQGFLLLAGISLEIPFGMVVLTRILPYKINRIVNLITPVIMIVYQIGSFSAGTASTLHYTFFSVVEVAMNAIILVLALRWKKPVVS